MVFLFCFAALSPVLAQSRTYESLDRGVVAVSHGQGKVFVSWRYLKSDPEDIAFNVYRAVGAQAAVKLNPEPIRSTTSFNYTEINLAQAITYTVRPVVDGTEQAPSNPFVLPASNPQYYFSIPMRQVAGDTNWAYEPNDASVGDLDGDGAYEIVVKRDNGGFDNAYSGVSPGTSRLQAYKLDGTFLWEVDLGPNIRQGAHYTHFMVFDFDLDGKAEVAVRTSELTTFGDGTQIGDVDGDGRTNYVITDNPSANTYGKILEGPEFLSLIEGTTGRELARVDYIERGDPSLWSQSWNWGDSYGNRMDRFLAGVGWFDGSHPSILICRGYYAKSVLEAWRWDGTQLTRSWRFSSTDAGNSGYAGQGNHNLSIGDVDGDGRDEVVYGACCIDDNGTGLYTTRLGHGDAMHLSDMDVRRPGLEVWQCHEPKPSTAGSEFRDARTGALIFGIPSTDDVGRGMASDIDPNYLGYELWTSRSGGVRATDGSLISANTPSVNFGLWFGGTLTRYLLDGVKLDRWTGNGTTRVMTFSDFGGATSINGTKSNPCLSGDIIGDWREEAVFKSADNRNLLVFSSFFPTNYRFYTLMHDRQYRNNIATQLVAYNQPPHPGFYLGSDLGRLAFLPGGVREITTTGSQVTLDAGYPYDRVVWQDDLGTSRTAVLTARNCGVRTKYVVECTLHGHVFRDSLYVTFQIPPVTASLSGNVLSVTGTGLLTYQWYRNGTLIPGANAAMYTAGESGSYLVRGTTSTGCVYESNAVSYYVTGLPDEWTGGEVVVHPNPSAGLFEVVLPETKPDILVQVENIRGANVFRGRMRQVSRFELPLEHCPSGIYLMYLRAGNDRTVKKLTIIK